MRFPGFIGPSYTLQSVNVDCQRCVNMYPEINDLGTGKEHEIACLAPTPGLRVLLTLPKFPIRCEWRASNDEVFVVAGNGFYRIEAGFTYTELGTLNTDTGPVSIADNGIQVFTVDGTYGYVWDIDLGIFNIVTDPNFLGSAQVTFQDGYFIFVKPNSEQFYISGLNAVTFDALDIGTAEGSPDNLVGQISSNQNLYLFGTQSTEVFYNSGDADFPFSRIQGAVIDVGCAAAFSIQKLPGGALAWLGGDSTGQGIVYVMQGYQAKRVSTTSVESVIRQRSSEEIAAARAWVYQQGGHIFYALNIPGNDSTWVYDVSTNQWHERTFLNLHSLERHRADCHAIAFGLNMVGDYQDGRLYTLDPDYFKDDTGSIARIRTAPHITKTLKRVFHQQFQLDMETGVGIDGVGQGTDPQAILDWSDDGGNTWSNEHWAGVGAIGEKSARVMWRRLGPSRDRVYRVKITDPVKVVLIGADLILEEGMN